MKKLNSKARITEVDDTSDRLLQIYAGEVALKDETFLKPLFLEMRDLSNRITEAIRRDRTHSELEDADLERDQEVTAIFKIVEGYTHMPLAEFRNPATRLWKILSNFGLGITRENFTTESSLIEALLTDLDSPSARTDVDKLLGLEQAIDALRTAQTAFNAKRIAYEQAKAGEKSAENAIALKNPLLNLINAKLLPYLEAMQMADAAKYAALSSGIEQAIADTNTAVVKRIKPKNSTQKGQS